MTDTVDVPKPPLRQRLAFFVLARRLDPLYGRWVEQQITSRVGTRLAVVALVIMGLSVVVQYASGSATPLTLLPFVMVVVALAVSWRQRSDPVHTDRLRRYYGLPPYDVLPLPPQRKWWRPSTGRRC